MIREALRGKLTRSLFFFPFFFFVSFFGGREERKKLSRASVFGLKSYVLRSSEELRFERKSAERLVLSRFGHAAAAVGFRATVWR